MSYTLRTTYDFRKMGRATTKEFINMVNAVADFVGEDLSRAGGRGEDIRGRKFQALKPATVKAKRRRNYPHPTVPLLATLRMIEGIRVSKRAKKGDISATVTVPKSRQDAGQAHNVGGGRLPQREFFGLAKRQRKTIDTTLKTHGINIVLAVRKRA